MGAFAKRFPTMLPASQPNNEIENETKEKTELNLVKILPCLTETSWCTRDNNPGGLRNVFKKGLSWEGHGKYDFCIRKQNTSQMT